MTLVNKPIDSFIIKNKTKMATVQFGTGQLKNPTPSGLSNYIQVFTVVGAIVLAWVGTASFIPLQTSSIIQSILGLLIGIANGIKPFFGVETNQKTVPIEDVTAMDETTKEKPV